VHGARRRVPGAHPALVVAVGGLWGPLLPSPARPNLA